MGVFDRDYSESRGFRPSLPPVTKWLLIINAVLFLVEILSREPYSTRGVLNAAGGFSVESGILKGHFWQLLTFQFLHASVGHVLFNCVGLYVFGPFVERWWGGRRFVAYYLLCGVAGGLFYTLLFYLRFLPNASVDTPLVGASAGIFGLIFAVYRLAPSVTVQLLFPPITLTLRQLALALGVWAVVMILGGLISPTNPLFWNSGGEAGHLGGALMGLLLMSKPQWLAWAEGKGGSVIRPTSFRRKRRAKSLEPKIRPKTRMDLTEESEVDRILEKISAEGIGSLTAEEREVLRKSAEREKS